MESWLRNRLADNVSAAAVWAMMTEAAITPRPGLVDRANSGAHRDMDFFTFIDSVSILLPWFRSCALVGFDSGVTEFLSGHGPSPDEVSPVALFEVLRPPGKMAEVFMKKATGGVNTNRGYIFSLGILSAAYGRLCRSVEKPGLAGVLEFSKAMTRTLGEDFSRSCKEPSHGEAAYAQTGIQDIRGEVIRGFPSVTEHALPLLRNLLNAGCSLNDAGTAAFLNLLAHTEDTNFIHRGGVEALRSIQQELRSFLITDPDMEAIREKAATMDKEFITKNLSPGGSADLLGTAFFLYRLFENSDRVRAGPEMRLDKTSLFRQYTLDRNRWSEPIKSTAPEYRGKRWQNQQPPKNANSSHG
jgi:holo-ACP synthase/triphosphoribosyl-dephospho-CoA synthase